MLPPPVSATYLISADQMTLSLCFKDAILSFKRPVVSWKDMYWLRAAVEKTKCVSATCVALIREAEVVVFLK